MYLYFTITQQTDFKYVLYSMVFCLLLCPSISMTPYLLRLIAQDVEFFGCGLYCGGEEKDGWFSSTPLHPTDH